MLDRCTSLDPHERALALENSEKIELAHANAGRQGDSILPDPDNVENHYVCFVNSTTSRKVYDMDGDKKGPLDKDVTLTADEDVLSKGVLRLVREYIDRDNGEKLNFNLMALVCKPL